MAQQTISRTIQWFGLLKIPTDVRERLKYYYLTFDLVRPPLSFYRNDRYSSPRGFWGYVQSVYGGRVISAKSIDYEQSLLEQFTDTNLFLHGAISCHLEAVLTSFINLGIGLQLPPIQRNNPIKDWRTLQIVPEEFRIKLLNEATVGTVTLHYELMDSCGIPEASPPPPPPPPPPLPRPPLPPTTPNNELPYISPPYVGPNDNGFTYNPNPGNPDPDFPQGEQCIIYIVTVEYNYDDDPAIRTTSGTYFGVINNVFRRVQVNQPDPERYEIAVECQGRTAQDAECLPNLVTRGGLLEGAIFNIVNVTVQEV